MVGEAQRGRLGGPAGGSAHQAGHREGLGARKQQRLACLPGRCTTPVIAATWRLLPSVLQQCHEEPANKGWRKRKKETPPPPSFVSSSQCWFLSFFFFFNPATLWSHPGPPASSHLLTGGCHTTDIFSGDSWPCGTQLEYGNGF